MGCGCRGGLRKPSPRSFVEPKLSAPGVRSLCANVEADGNNLTIRVAADGRLYLTSPSSSDVPVVSLLSSSGCRGAFAQALVAANSKLSSIFMSPESRARFQAALPVANVKLGFLREILKTF